MFTTTPSPKGYEVALYLTSLAIFLGTCSCILGAFNFFILTKMRENVNYGGLRFSSVVMIRNLVAADGFRGLFLLTGMIRYLIIFYAPFGQDPQNPCDFDFYCRMQSFMSIWLNMITIICILFIGIFAAYQISPTRMELKVVADRILIYVSIGCWIIPFLLTIIPASFNVLGEDRSATTSGWCWITSCNKTTSPEQKVTFMILYSRGLETVIFITNVTLFIYLKYVTRIQEQYVRNETSNDLVLSAISDIISIDGNNSIKKDSKVLLLINLTICFCRLPGLARTGIDIAMTYVIPNSQYQRDLHNAARVLLDFQAIADGLQSSLVFGVLLLCSRFAKKFLKKCLFRSKLSSSNTFIKVEE